jgi:uncharacterized membrane protein
VQRILAAALAIGVLLWSAALLAAPLALHSGNIRLAAGAALFYEAAGLVCHQRLERSFSLAAIQMPVCARCTGLYFSAAAGALVAWLLPPRASTTRATRWLLALAALPTAVTFGLEVIGLAYPSNVTRALSALPLGAAVAWVLVSSLRTDAVESAMIRG